MGSDGPSIDAMITLGFFFFFNRKFQFMASALDDNSLSLNQDINRILV